MLPAPGLGWAGAGAGAGCCAGPAQSLLILTPQGSALCATRNTQTGVGLTSDARPSTQMSSLGPTMAR